MRFNFLLPFPATKPVGGVKIMYEYANRISMRGHTVRLLHSIRRPFRKSSTPVWIKRLLFYLRNVERPSWFNLREEVESKIIPEASERFMPDADVTISTWWEMAYMLSKLSERKGVKVNLVQDHELWNGSEELVRASYRLPVYPACVSKHLMQIVGAYADSAPLYLPNAIDSSVFACTIPPQNRDPLSVMMLFSPEPRKGSAFGIQALELLRARFPKLKVTLFGVHPKPKIPNWMNYQQKPADLAGLYNQHALFLSPSLVEGWALPLAEAMSCGCATVCTDSGGPRDYAIDRRTAAVVPTHSAEAIMEALSGFIESPTHRLEVALRGMDFIQTRFSWDQNVDRLVNKTAEWSKTLRQCRSMGLNGTLREEGRPSAESQTPPVCS
jgi:glycosyltransferase involved in cell wall biosynthesis